MIAPSVGGGAHKHIARVRVAVHESVPKNLISVALGQQARHGRRGQSQTAQTDDVIDAHTVDKLHQHDAARGVHDGGKL